MAAIGKDAPMNEEEFEAITDGPVPVPGEAGGPAPGSAREHLCQGCFRDQVRLRSGRPGCWYRPVSVPYPASLPRPWDPVWWRSGCPGVAGSAYLPRPPYSFPVPQCGDTLAGPMLSVSSHLISFRFISFHFIPI